MNADTGTECTEPAESVNETPANESPPSPPPIADSAAGKLLSATLHYGVGKSLPQLVRFLLLPLYARFLTATDYGIIELTTALGASLEIVMRLGIPGSVTRFYFDYREGPELKDYVTTIARVVLTASVVIGGLALLFGRQILAWTMPSLSFYPFGVLAVLAAMITCNQNLQDRLVQAREQAAYAAKLNLWRAAVSISLSLLLVIGFNQGAVGMLTAELIVGVIFFVQAARYLAPDLTGRFRPRMLVGTLNYSFAMLLTHMIAALGNLITQAVLARTTSIAIVGQLAIANRFMQPLTIVSNAFQTAFNPVYFRLRSAGTSESSQSLAAGIGAAWTVFSALALAGVLLVPSLIQLMLPEGLHPAGRLTPILCLNFLITSVPLALAYTEIFYRKTTRWVPLLLIVSVGVTVSITLAAAPTYGALGLAWATVAGSTATAAAAFLVIGRAIDAPHAWGESVRLLASASPIVAAHLLLPTQSPAWMMLRGLFLLFVFVGLLWMTGNSLTREIGARLRFR